MGELERWGIDGPIVRWGQRVPGRRRIDGWDVLLGPEPASQQFNPPPARVTEATDKLVRFQPLLPKQSVDLQTFFDGAYDHGDEIEAVLTYISLDPTHQPICSTAERPMQLAFVPCAPVTEFEQDSERQYYMPVEELGRDQQRVRVACSVMVEHPRFDIEEARAQVGIGEGSFGYDTVARRWILVDPRARLTVVVGPSGIVDTLPGDWLRQLLVLNSSPAAQIAWHTSSGKEADRVVERLRDRGIEVERYTHKGETNPSDLRISVNRETVATLGQVMADLGLLLDGGRVVGR
jgi:hypothetical protein